MLDKRQVRIAEERSARKEPLTDKEARALLKRVSEVIVARGTKFERRPASKTKVADLKGPSGNYRAPMLIKGRTLLVGFNAEALSELV